MKPLLNRVKYDHWHEVCRKMDNSMKADIFDRINEEIYEVTMWRALYDSAARHIHIEMTERIKKHVS